jgi:hypothetical protein
VAWVCCCNTIHFPSHGRGRNTEIRSRWLKLCALVCWTQFPVTLVSSLWMIPTVSHCTILCNSYSRNVPLFWTRIFFPFLCCETYLKWFPVSPMSPSTFAWEHAGQYAILWFLELLHSIGLVFVSTLRMVMGSNPIIALNIK